MSAMPARVPKAARRPASKGNDAEQILPLRITLVNPPAGVQFCLQSGKSELISPTVPNGDDIRFDFTVRVQPGNSGQESRFLGPFTQGPPQERFVYVCSGTMAAQSGSPWTRRAKIPLMTISATQVTQALKQPSAVLEARIDGKAKDGGPACATVPLLGGGWTLVSMQRSRG